MENNNLKIQYQSLMIEYEMLQNELKELNSLYSEIKQEKENNKNTGSRLNYVFIAAQNSSLISIKTQRSNIISKMNDIRRNIEELRIKEFNLNKNTEEDQGSSIGLIRELLAGVVSKEIKQEDFVNKENTNSEKDKEKELEYTNTDNISDFLDDQFTTDEEGLLVETSKEDSLSSKGKLEKYLLDNNYSIYYLIDEERIVCVNNINVDEILTPEEFAYKYNPSKDIEGILKDLKVVEVIEKLGTAETNIGFYIEIVSMDVDNREDLDQTA